MVTPLAAASGTVPGRILATHFEPIPAKEARRYASYCENTSQDTRFLEYFSFRVNNFESNLVLFLINGIPKGTVGIGTLFGDTSRMLPDGPGRSQGASGSTPAGHSELISAKEVCWYASCCPNCCYLARFLKKLFFLLRNCCDVSLA